MGNSSRLFLALNSESGVSNYYVGINSYLGTDYGPISDGFWGSLGLLAAGSGGGFGQNYVQNSVNTGLFTNRFFGINSKLFGSAAMGGGSIGGILNQKGFFRVGWSIYRTSTSDIHYIFRIGLGSSKLDIATFAVPHWIGNPVIKSLR